MIDSARELLDTGGENAVTMRAVGHLCGLSHNASYKHFKSRKALLAAVAAEEFFTLTERLDHLHETQTNHPLVKLEQALDIIIEYSVTYPDRYHLLFAADMTTVEMTEDLARGARMAFDSFCAIVTQTRENSQQGAIPDASLAGIMLATLQGLKTQEDNGRVNIEKGQLGVRDGMKLLVSLIIAKSSIS
ncbi:TetR/AcrR family transcriptional regulator [Luteolibacter pohnpeiensis]|uniref:TetR/AcrR family transcriptional regulator n=1 Tax=Luteolibacter pohnpeiensis TaxID=454153 RepID=A0A934SAA9_9BACT|nr:TetR/AcrR family transcriptional regulator [Luteolibacter pohnpeiensis]MBK1883771.1 TetR/AcrR family transcriptional regulator [Luteolibacter pohnpeiensis]